MRRFPDWNCVVPYAFCLKGELDVLLLRRSLDEITRRHGALRTTIPIVHGTPKLEICNSHTHRLDIVTVAGHPRAEVEKRARQLFAQFAATKMATETGPLFEVSLLKLSDREHWLLLAIHRLVADCFSAEQLLQEIWALYGQSASSRPASLVTDPPQYSDYALWQETQAGQWLQRHEDYWSRRLGGATSVRWPVDSAAVQAGQPLSAMMSRHFGKELSERVSDFARHARSLAAMIILTVYVAVMWRWNGQRDFVVPFNVAGRQSEHKLVVGYFAHILYLRIQLTGEETFDELQRLVSGEFFRALAHQDFGRQAAQRPELLAGTFCQWVTWHPGTASDQSNSASAPRLDVQRLPLSEFGQGLSMLPPSMVDVDLTFFDTDQGIYAQGVYRADRFLPTTIERLMRTLLSATELFVRNPRSSLTALPSISVQSNDL